MSDMDGIENWVLFLGCSEYCLSQGTGIPSLNMQYSWALRVPSHHMVTGIPQVFTEAGSAQTFGLGWSLQGNQRLSARTSSLRPLQAPQH
jgi:hypothetical protein